MATDEVEILFTAKTRGAKKNVDGLTGSISKSGKSVEKSMSGQESAILRVGAALVALKSSFDIVTSVATDTINAFRQQQVAENQLNTVIKSTGNVAGVSAKELKAFAASLQDVTTFGDEAIIGVQSLLLTFKQIDAETLNRATMSILDVSQAMGQDLKTSAVQVGKALNDPIAGLSALSRVGITFTEQQKAQIKTLTNANQVAKAQAIILGELESQFQGSAAAAAEGVGAIDQLSNTYGDLQESIGELIFKTLQPLIKFLNNLS